jgi:hypothetical protein
MNFILPRLNTRADRAKAGLNFRCNYQLRRGGYNAAHPLNPAWDFERSDCSGFVSHVLSTRRSPKPGRKFWIETTAIYNDAKHDHEVFREIPEPINGCLVVYGDRKPAFLQPKREGHIGVVVNVGNPSGQFDTVECASGTLGKIGRAIRLRKQAAAFWKSRDAIFCVLNEDIA